MTPTTYIYNLGHDVDDSWQYDNWDDYDDWRENNWQADNWSSSPSSPSSSFTPSRSSSCDRPDPQHIDPDFEMPVLPLPPSHEEEGEEKEGEEKGVKPFVPSQTQETTQSASIWSKVRRMRTPEEMKFIWLPMLAFFLALSAVLFIPGHTETVKSLGVQDDEPKSVSSSTSVTIWMMQWKTETVAVSETVTVSTMALETVYSTVTEAPTPASVVGESKAGDTALEYITRVESIMEKLNWATKSGQTPGSTTLPTSQDHRPLIRQNCTTLSTLHHRQRSQSSPSISLNNPLKAISTAMWAEFRTLICPIFPTFGPCRRYAAAVEEQLLKIEWELRKHDLWDWLMTRKEDCIDWLAHNKNVPCPNTEGTTWEEVCEDEEGLGDNDCKRIDDEKAEETNEQDTETGRAEIYKDEL